MATVSISEAALRLGISRDTVRKQVKSGKLNGEKVQVPAPGGYRWLIDLPDPNQDLEYPQKADMGEIAALGELVRSLRSEIGLLEKQIEVKDQQINVLQTLLQQQSLNLRPPTDVSRNSPRRGLFGSRKDQG